jgi:trehalose/maltose hydrolase-like predicted phosphorylase
MSKPLSPPPETRSGQKELPAYVSNGVIGLRVRTMPLAAGMALLNGFAGRHHKRQIEAAAVAPYPLAADVALDGVWLSDLPHSAANFEQSYDLSAGELTTSFTFSAAGAIARVEVLTFCSRPDPSLACQEVRIDTDRPCTLTIRAMIDATCIAGRPLYHSRETPGEPEPAVDGSLLWESEGGFGTCGIAFSSELLGAGEQDPQRPPLRGNQLVTQYSVRVRANRPIRLRQISSLLPNLMHALPEQQTSRLAAKARRVGFDTIRKANRAAWDELWKGRIVITGADVRWQGLIDAAFFYLNTSVHPSSSASTSIFGLATWHDYHYYFGHVMWDIEAFAIPPLCLLQPHAAEALLDYRVRHLESARANARLYGRRGLQFPWESAPGSGEEAAPMPGTAAWHEDHVSLDVAKAFAAYAEMTGDQEFLRTKAWPVLSGVAEWLTIRAVKTSRGYEIKESMGIAERESPVDNAAFTNMAAVIVLRDAIGAAERLGYPINPAWVRMADQMVIPKRGAAVISHDDYRVSEEKGATPDPLMGLFPFGYRLDAEGEKATTDAYLDAAQDYIGSPMLSALYGAWAARAGHRALALKLLDDGYGQFCTGRFLQTLEYRTDRFPEQPQAGPFFANIGGFLTGILFGFTGLKPGPDSPETWMERPVCLPQGWSCIEVERLWVRGEPMRLTAEHGMNAVLTRI